tara:strand:+ start:7 stop:729 length:723 start_codon:yes stop_codon:yes gene_type:complete
MSEIRVENIIGETGTDAVKFTKGINVTGVTTATTFSGSGASLTNLPAANLTGTLPAISGANLTGISSGEYSLAYANEWNHSVTTTVNGSGLSDGSAADNRRDCVIINNGNYHTVTPAHVDDKLVMGLSTNVASNWTSTGTYWGLGFMSATDTGFSANRNVFYLMGQHSQGNGSAGGDEYRQTNVTLQRDVSDIGLNVGTTYYIRPIGQVHSPNQNVSFNNSSGNNSGARHNCYLHHYKKN